MLHKRIASEVPARLGIETIDRSLAPIRLSPVGNCIEARTTDGNIYLGAFAPPCH